MNKSRTENTIKNVKTGFIVQLINKLMAFVVRTVFIKCLNSDYLGVNGLFTNVLTILSFAELGIGTAIIFSIDGNNYVKIKEMIEVCKKYNVKQFSFSRLDICFNKIKNNYINKKEYLELSKELQKIRAEEENIHITSNDAIWKGCGACSTTLTVLSNGDIVPCAYINIKCGSIKDRDINKAWLSETFKNIRESNLEGKCGDCKYSFLCKGCRAIPFIKEDNYLGEDKGCWL